MKGVTPMVSISFIEMGLLAYPFGVTSFHFNSHEDYFPLQVF
jgi:hypothetical protein